MRPPDDPQDAPRASPPARPGPIAAWLFFAGGVTLLVAAGLIPASDDLGEARWQRDAVLALERHALERIDRHQRYLDALDRADPPLVRALAASQLGLVDAETDALVHPNGPNDPMLFEAMEPPPVAIPARHRVDSRLQSWATGGRSRLWMLAGGAVLVLLGLLPSATR